MHHFAFRTRFFRFAVKRLTSIWWGSTGMDHNWFFSKLNHPPTSCRLSLPPYILLLPPPLISSSFPPSLFLPSPFIAPYFLLLSLSPLYIPPSFFALLPFPSPPLYPLTYSFLNPSSPSLLLPILSVPTVTKYSVDHSVDPPRDIFTYIKYIQILSLSPFPPLSSSLPHFHPCPCKPYVDFIWKVSGITCHTEPFPFPPLSIPPLNLPPPLFPSARALAPPWLQLLC